KDLAPPREAGGGGILRELRELVVEERGDLGEAPRWLGRLGERRCPERQDTRERRADGVPRIEDPAEKIRVVVRGMVLRVRAPPEPELGRRHAGEAKEGRGVAAESGQLRRRAHRQKDATRGGIVEAPEDLVERLLQ